ncbi:MAG: patatin-like phospholipase family protein [Gemmataceae bacterium]|nr:patatin-like phospholipase family protein [Gemmataceae bacterium]
MPPTPRTGLTLALLGLALAAGCASRQRCHSCRPPELARASGLVPANPTGDADDPLDADAVRALANQFRSGYQSPATPAKPANVLALSGGGKYGAYSVGALCGWTATGTRPTFDVVTGVSTGGLIATFAFLGPKYDERMTRVYTAVTDRDIYTKRRPAAILWSDSAADSAPLKRLIDSQVDDEMMAEAARAHAAGRRLYVGTTDVDTRRLVIWDLGAIAASGRPDAKDLVRKVLLATASPPGFFPPVEIDTTVNGQRYTELHVDGGATTGVFLRAATLPVDREALRAGRQPLAGSNAYVIVAGKLYADPSCTDRRTVRIGESSLRSLLYSQTRGELYRIYTLCLLGGMKYHLTAIPEDYQVGSDAMSFDPAEMKRLYEAGYATMTGGRAWRDTPPGAEPHEQVRPRTGTDFYAPGAAK